MATDAGIVTKAGVDVFTQLGIDIDGPFNDAIYGHNVNNVTINDVTINGTGGGVNGIAIVKDVSGNSTIIISNSSISNVSHDGVTVTNTISDGGTSTENITLDHTTIAGSGHDGVYVGSTVSGGSSLTINETLTSSPISGSGSSDVALVGTVAAGSSLTQNLTIDPTTISGGLYGVLVDSTANGGTRSSRRAGARKPEFDASHLLLQRSQE